MINFYYYSNRFLTKFDKTFLKYKKTKGRADA